MSAPDDCEELGELEELLIERETPVKEVFLQNNAIVLRWYKTADTEFVLGSDHNAHDHLFLKAIDFEQLNENFGYALKANN